MIANGQQARRQAQPRFAGARLDVTVNRSNVASLSPPAPRAGSPGLRSRGDPMRKNGRRQFTAKSFLLRHTGAAGRLRFFKHVMIIRRPRVHNAKFPFAPPATVTSSL